MEVNKIHNINFLDNNLPDKCAKLIIADPPYFEVKGEFDYINMAQLPLDLLQDVGILDDDDTENIVPMFLPNIYDKDHAGLNLYIGTKSEIIAYYQKAWEDEETFD